MNVVNFGSANIIGGNLTGLVSTATSGGTSTLTVDSVGRLQIVGTTTTHNVDLPNATTLTTTGQRFEIINDSSAVTTVKDAAGTTKFSLGPGIRLYAMCTDTSTSAGSWSFDVMSMRPERLCTNGIPGNTSGTAKYTSSTTLTTDDLYNGPISLYGTFSVTTPAATTLNADLTTILGSAPPPGFNFQACLWSASGTQYYYANSDGCTWLGPTTGAGSNYTGQLWVQIISPTSYYILNMRDY